MCATIERSKTSILPQLLSTKCESKDEVLIWQAKLKPHSIITIQFLWPQTFSMALEATNTDHVEDFRLEEFKGLRAY